MNIPRVLLGAAATVIAASPAKAKVSTVVETNDGLEKAHVVPSSAVMEIIREKMREGMLQRLRLTQFVKGPSDHTQSGGFSKFSRADRNKFGVDPASRYRLNPAKQMKQQQRLRQGSNDPSAVVAAYEENKPGC